MAINPNNGVLDIINGTLKVSSIDIKQAAGFTTALNTVARNDVLLFDDQKATTVFTPTSEGGYTSSTGVSRDTTEGAGYIDLNDGWVYWPLQLPNSWHTEFDMHVTTTGGVLTFSLFNTSEPNHTDYTNNDGGYKIVFDNTNNQIDIYWEGSIHKTVGANLRSSDWQHVNINYFQGAISVSLAGKVVLTHEFTQNYQEFNSRYVGFSATTGASHKIRHLRVHNSDKWLYTKTSNASDITYVSGNVGIGTLTPTELLDVHGNVHIAKDLTVNGNLTVSGTTTFIDTQNLAIEDPIIEVARGNASDTIDAGLVITRATSNVAVAYRGDEEELALGYTQSGASDTDVTPITDGGLDVRVYGNLFANNLTTTANVEATYLKGNGSEITHVTLDQVVGYANTTANTIQLTNSDIGLKATGNVKANYFIGNGSKLTGLVTDLQSVTDNGNVTSNTVQFTNATTAFVADSNVGIGTDTPAANLHVVGYQYVNDPPTIANAFDHSDAPLTLTHGTPTSTTAVDDPKAVLHLTRDGTSGESYGARASFNLSRYENSGTASRSRLDVALTDGTYAEANVMSIRADGKVGIGTTTPGYTLDVRGTSNVGALTATSISGPLSGNADTATALETARTIGGVSFDGSGNIDLPGVNTTGNQNTSGNAATATTATNQSGGTVSATTGTFSGDVEVTGELTTKSNVFLGVMEGFAREGTLEFGRADGTDRVHNIKVYNSSTQTDNYMKFQIHAGGASAGTVTDNVLYLRGDGNVGIGTDSPGYALDVHGTSNVGALTATSLSGDGSGLTSLDAGNISSGTIDKDRLPTTLNNTTIGSLAIGANDVTLTAKVNYHGLKILKAFDSPDEPATLLLAGDGDVGDDIAFEIRGNGTGSDVDTTTTRDSSDTTFGILHTGHTYIGYPNLNPGETGGNAQNGDPMLNVSGDIYATGNVGIGTASPGYALDVHGTSNVGALTATSLSGDGSGLSALNASNVSSGILTRPISTTTGVFTSTGNAVRVGPYGGGQVGLTINDGDGNCNLTFNHASLIPDQNGSSGRIDCGVDGTSGYMRLRVKDNVTGGTSTGNLPECVRIEEGYVRAYSDFYAGGNVGIGTSSPQYKLDVDGGTTEGDGDVMLRMFGGVNKVGKLIFGRTGNSDIRSHAIESITNSGGANNYMKFLVHDGGSSSPYETRTEVMTLLGNGNVGIGTTSPATDFHVGVGDANIRIGAINYSGSAADTTTYGLERSRNQILFSTWRDAQTDKIGAKICGINKQTYSSPTLRHLIQSTDLAFYTVPPGSASYDGTVERLRITDTGYVGIGTDSPATYLHLSAKNSDPGSTEGDLVGTHTLTEYLRFTSLGDVGDVNSVTVGFKLGGDDNSSIQPDGRLDICANDGASAGNGYGLTPDRTIATFLGSGNVGIGTTSPTKSLEIDGTTLRHAYEYTYQDTWTSNNNQTFTIPVTGLSARGEMLVEAEVIQVASNSSAERFARVKGIITNYHTGTFNMTVFEGENATAFETYIVGTSGLAAGTFTMKYQPQAGYLQNVLCRLNLKIFIGGFTSSLGSLTRTDAGSNSALTAPTLNSAPKIFGGNVGIGTDTPVYKLDVHGTANVGALTTTSVSGDGSGLTSLNASNVNTGTFDAAKISSGTVADDTGGVKAVYFDNTEQSGYYTDKSGILAFDENFYDDTEYGTGTYDPDSTFVGGNGGGLLIKNEDGWGAIFTSQNTRWAKGYWNALDITNTVTATSYRLTGDATPYKQSIKNDTNLAVGWYRIAENGNAADTASNGSRCSARFTIIDYDSGLHSTRTLYAGGTYGNKPFIHLLTNTSYGADGNISKVRVVEGSTYEGLAVEIYVDTACNANEIRIVMDDNYQVSGFTMVNFESVVANHSNMNEYELNLNTTFWGMFLDNTTTNICMLESGNVGIGTASPGYKLHVNGSSMFTSTINLTTSSGYAAFEMGGPSGAYIDLKNPASDDYDLRLITTGTGGSILVGGVGDVMKFDGSGNVGIGTDSPGYKLDVAGSFRVNGGYTSTFGNDGLLHINSRSTTYGSETVALQTTIDNRALTATNPGTYGGESRNVLALQPDGGYVGIGTTSPTAKLHVNGAIYAPGHPVQYVGQNVHDIVVYGNSIGRYIFPLDITITPKFSNSKIMLHWVINAEAHHDQVIRIYRFISSGASSLIGFNSNNQGVHSGAAPIHHDNDHNSTMNTHTVAWVDTPNTTSAVTYRIFSRPSNNGSNWFRLNRTVGGGSLGQFNHEIAVSYKSAMEIAV